MNNHFEQLDNTFSQTSEFGDTTIVVTLNKNHQIINKNIKVVQEIYNENYKKNYDIKSDEEVRKLVGKLLGKAIAFFGSRIITYEYFDIFSIDSDENDDIFDEEGGDHSVLIPKLIKKNHGIEITFDRKNEELPLPKIPKNLQYPESPQFSPVFDRKNEELPLPKIPKNLQYPQFSPVFDRKSN